MSDREKVIKAWECCNPFNRKCNECPYERDCYHDGISRHMVADALALLKEQQGQIDRLIEENASNAEMAEGLKELLKEQEAVKPVLDEQTGRIWLCGKCGSYVGFEDNDPYDPNEFDKYCRECGRPVLWKGR